MTDFKRNTGKRESVDFTVDGHKVKISFANEHNPGVAQLIKDTLIDSFIRNIGITAEQPVRANVNERI